MSLHYSLDPANPTCSEFSLAGNNGAKSFQIPAKILPRDVTLPSNHYIFIPVLVLIPKPKKMAEGMEVDPAPAVRDKKRFEVKKVALIGSTVLLTHVDMIFLTFVLVERGGFVVLG